MSKICNGYLISVSMLLALSVSLTTSNVQGLQNPQVINSEEVNKRVEELEKRLNQLEPSEPITLIKPPWEAEAQKYYPLDTCPFPK